MKIIKDKKIQPKVLSVILYFSVCFGSWYYIRSLASFLSIMYFNNAMGLILANAIVATFLFGLLFFAIINPLFVRAVHPYKLSGVNNSMLLYVFRLFFAIGSFIYGGFSFIYFAFPLIGFYGDLIFKFVFLTAALVFGFIYSVKNGYIPKHRIGKALYSAGGTYLITYAVIIIVKILIFYLTGAI